MVKKTSPYFSLARKGHILTFNHYQGKEDLHDRLKQFFSKLFNSAIVAGIDNT